MAKAVTVAIPHELGKAEARRRVEQGFSSLEAQLGGTTTFQERWEGDRMHFTGGTLGQTISGHADVGESQVVVEVLLPRLLTALAGSIQGRLQKQGTRLLEKKT